MNGLGEDRYDKPFIRDMGRERCLHFDIFTVQSAMDLDDPDRLSLPYTRKMMAFLLFNGAPSVSCCSDSAAGHSRSSATGGYPRPLSRPSK